MKLAARFSETMTLPLLVLLATLLAALALIKLSADRAVFDSQQAQLRDAQTRLQKSGTEKELIIRHLPDYAKLDALGFVGDEQRINWLDALRHANQKGGLFGINYDIAARKAYPHAATLNPGGVNVSQIPVAARSGLDQILRAPGGTKRGRVFAQQLQPAPLRQHARHALSAARQRGMRIGLDHRATGARHGGSTLKLKYLILLSFF